MINQERLVRTFCDLARIDSPSGEEEAVAQEVGRRLSALGFQVARDDYGNVIASEEGDEPLLLSAHLDTVEPGRGVQPTVQGDRILSEGATVLGGDCKAGVAAILEALESISEEGIPRMPVQLAFTREEEMGLVGAKHLDYSLIRARQAVVFDGGGPVNRVTSGSPTYLRFDVRVTGRSAHAGVEPERGLSAIHIAAEVVAQLPQGRLDEETTFNVGLITGGSARNAVPEQVTFAGEFRSRNRDTLDRLHRQLSQTLQRIGEQYPEARIEMDSGVEFEMYTLDPEEPVAERVMMALATLGLEAALGPSGGGTDGNVFRTHGIPAVVVGMATNTAHTTREYVEVPQLVEVARFCQALLTSQP